MIDLASLFPKAESQVAPTAIGTFVLASGIKILVVFALYLLGVAFLTLAERKLADLDGHIVDHAARDLGVGQRPCGGIVGG